MDKRRVTFGIVVLPLMLAACGTSQQVSTSTVPVGASTTSTTSVSSTTNPSTGTSAFEVNYSDPSGDAAQATVQMGAPESAAAAGVESEVSQCNIADPSRALVESVYAGVQLTSNLPVDNALITFRSTGSILFIDKSNPSSCNAGNVQYSTTLVPKGVWSNPALFIVMVGAITPDNPSPAPDWVAQHYLLDGMNGQSPFPALVANTGNNLMNASAPWGPRALSCTSSITTTVFVDTAVPLATQVDLPESGGLGTCTGITIPQQVK